MCLADEVLPHKTEKRRLKLQTGDSAEHKRIVRRNARLHCSRKWFVSVEFDQRGRIDEMPRHSSALAPLPSDFVSHRAGEAIFYSLGLLPVPTRVRRNRGRRVGLDDKTDRLVFRQPKGIERLQHTILENGLNRKRHGLVIGLVLSRRKRALNVLNEGGTQNELPSQKVIDHSNHKILETRVEFFSRRLIVAPVFKINE